MTRLLSTMLAVVAACATAPKSADDKHDLQMEANATLTSMMGRDPGLHHTLQSSAGYVVFPNIGKGGFIAGAAYGRGIMFQHGHQTGFVELNQGSLGAQIGAQSFAELIVFRNDADVSRVMRGSFTLGGNISAVVLTTGAAATAGFVGGIAVFVVPRGGAMAELTVSGQTINYKPLGG